MPSHNPVFMKLLFYLIICLPSLLRGNCQNTDINWLRDINSNRNIKLDEPFIFITKSAAPVSIAVPVSIFTTGLVANNEKLKTDGFRVAASLAVTTLLVTGLKYSVNRTRPFEKYNDIEQVIPVSTPSFPSGHTGTAFSTAASLSLAFPKWYVVAPSFLWASAVGYSRMHLGEHYPSDVLAGALTGAGSAYLCHRAQQWIFKRKATGKELK